MGRKVIIDCDAGVDDAFALILAFHSPELKVEAITGVNGNVPLDQVFENIQKVLCLIRPYPKPIITKGADQPLKGKPIYAHSVHGEDGLGGAIIDREKGEEWWEVFPHGADELIPEIARRHSNEITLVATGPLTNLALGLQKDFEGMKRLKEIVIMGGAIRTRGNITPYAEFNIFSDPLATRLVFESGIPITLVPLDVTHRVFLTPPLIEKQISPLKNAFSRFVIQAAGYDAVAHQFRRGEVKYLHDPLAVAVAIDPDLVKKEKLSVCVETEEGERYGQISEAFGETTENMEIEACLEVDSEAFLKLFLSRLT